MKAMILAAGRGDRMRPLTDETPKPLLTVGGRPLIDYQLAALASGGIDEVVINLSWLGAKIRAMIGTGDKYGLNVTYSDEGAEALETGGGIYRALPRLGPDPFWLVNGDVFGDFRYDLRPLAPGVLGHLIMVENPVHHPRGDYSLADGRVTARGLHSWTYAGISMLHPDLFAGAADGRFPLAPLFDTAIGQRALTGEVFDGRWVDVGTPERLAALDRALSGSA